MKREKTDQREKQRERKEAEVVEKQTGTGEEEGQKSRQKHMDKCGKKEREGKRQFIR